MTIFLREAFRIIDSAKVLYFSQEGLTPSRKSFKKRKHRKKKKKKEKRKPPRECSADWYNFSHQLTHTQHDKGTRNSTMRCRQRKEGHWYILAKDWLRWCHNCYLVMIIISNCTICDSEFIHAIWVFFFSFDLYK